MKPAGLLRVFLAAIYCAAGVFVLFDLAAKHHWEMSLRAPFFLLIGAAYSARWKANVMAVAPVVALVSVLAAALLALEPALGEAAPRGSEEVLGLVSLVALALTILIWAWTDYRAWRAYRAGLKARCSSAVERASGGF